MLSSECATREIFAKILFGIRKWSGPEVETTIVSLGDESDADQWFVNLCGLKSAIQTKRLSLYGLRTFHRQIEYI